MLLFHPAELYQRVAHLGDVLELVVCEDRPRTASGFFLWIDGRRLGLYRGSDPRGIFLSADDYRRRATFANALARACGVTHGHRPHVVDAMAGLGTDGMTLAELGCQVTLFEREAPLWALLDDFLSVNPVPGARLHRADSIAWLRTQRGACCDTLYLDPLFPPRAKRALPGKAMQYVRALAERSQDPPAGSLELALPLTADWIQQAASVVRERVVLKRRLRDPAVGVPAWQIKARTVRYDVYRGAA